jgi:alkylhydroperoxidase family enzyme
MRALGELAALVTTAPWTLRGAAQFGLSDEDIVQVVVQSAFFGHLNRVADAVAVPLDYQVQHPPPPANILAPRLQAAPLAVGGERGRLSLALRPATQTALAAWHAHIQNKRFYALIAARVAYLIGESAETPVAADDLERAVLALVTEITLAPWLLLDADYAELRALGLDDTAIFDIVATASAATMFSRLAVAFAVI